MCAGVDLCWWVYVNVCWWEIFDVNILAYKCWCVLMSVHIFVSSFSYFQLLCAFFTGPCSSLCAQNSRPTEACGSSVQPCSLNFFHHFLLPRIIQLLNLWINRAKEIFGSKQCLYWLYIHFSGERMPSCPKSTKIRKFMNPILNTTTYFIFSLKDSIPSWIYPNIHETDRNMKQKCSFFQDLKPHWGRLPLIWVFQVKRFLQDSRA